jgi:phosphate transport system substrate-binding protein
MYTQPGIKFVAVDQVLPSNETIQNREYGYTNPFYGVLSKTSSKDAENILNWLVSVEGQKLVEECGYVPFYQVGE